MNEILTNIIDQNIFLELKSMLTCLAISSHVSFFFVLVIFILNAPNKISLCCEHNSLNIDTSAEVKFAFLLAMIKMKQTSENKNLQELNAQREQSDVTDEHIYCQE